MIRRASIFVLLVLPLVVGAEGGYVNLVGLPTLAENSADGTVNSYVNNLYLLAIGIAAMLAVLKLIFAGVKYITTDVVTKKGDAKGDILTAVIGLLIVLSAVFILETINPQLKNFGVLDRMEPIIVKITSPPEVYDGVEDHCYNNLGRGNCVMSVCPQANMPGASEVCELWCDDYSNSVYDDNSFTCAHEKVADEEYDTGDGDLDESIQGTITILTDVTTPDELINPNKSLTLQFGPQPVSRRENSIRDCSEDGGTSYEIFTRQEVDIIYCYQ